MKEQLVPALLDGVINADVNATGFSSSSVVVSASNLASESGASNDANSSKSNSIYDDDDEDGDVCRICSNPGDDTNPLRYPCVCSGSIKFVHENCLLKWLNHSNTRKCEICKHPFSFSPVYADNAPAKLPYKELVIGMSMKLYHVLPYVLCVIFVLFMWLVIIPLCTSLFWSFSFVTSFRELDVYMNHFVDGGFHNYVPGFLLSASIMFICFKAISLRDYFIHLREVGGDRDVDGDRPPAEPNQNFNGGGEHGIDVEQMFDGLDDEEDADHDVPFGVAGELIKLYEENVADHIELLVEDILYGLNNEEDEDNDPFVGLRVLFFRLVETAVYVLISNVIFLCIMIFFPFHLGRFILYLRSWILSSATNTVLSIVVPLTEPKLQLTNITLKIALSDIDFTPGYSPNASVFNATSLATGYMFIVSIVAVYFGIVEVIRYIKGEPLIMGRFYGIDSITETICSLFKRFMTMMKHLATMIKVPFILAIELGLIPLMCGWLLDICTVRMFGKTIGQRVDFFSMSSLASLLIHWVLGIVYMLVISVFVSLLRGVLRNEVLYFLRDPADPNDPMPKHAHRVLLSVAVYLILIVIFVFLPVKLSMRMIPSIFPLDISLFDPFIEIPASMLFIQICIPFAINHFKLQATIKSLLHYWFVAVGWALGLTDFLLPRPGDTIVQQDRNWDPVRYQQSDPEKHGFLISVVLLLLAACMTLVILNSMLITVPISIGRALFKAVLVFPISHGMKCNDLYAFIIGSYVISTMVAGSRFFIHQIRTERATVLLSQILKWCTIFVKSSLLLSIWIFAIPVMIGLLFDLLIILYIKYIFLKSGIPVDVTPVFLLEANWAIGLIILMIWTQLVDDSWHLKFERVRRNGFSRLQGVWVVQEIVIPIVMKLLTALCFPYILNRGVFSVFWYPSIVSLAVVKRFAWVGCLGVFLVLNYAKGLCAHLHNSIRDD